MIDVGAIAALYGRQGETHKALRARLGRPLTLTEKILGTHLADAEQAWERGKSFLLLRPDRVALQDATAQMALLQFMVAGRRQTAVPTTVHCDHLIQARRGVDSDMREALEENDEVFRFLRDVSQKFGIGFWRPGAGIIHQVVLENYAFPGGLMIGTDSHTPNAGGLGMFAAGVGGADAVDVMVDMPWEVLAPRVIGVHLRGSFSGWTSPKDVISRLCEVLTVKGGTNAVLEYFGSGTEAISCTGKATITNMGAELGATTSLFPFDARMATYLRATRREEVAALAEAHADELRADAEVVADPSCYYDQVVEIDLDSLEPRLVGPHSPDIGRSVSEMGADAVAHGWPLELKAALIGSCTNSSYEDLGRAADVASQAAAAGLKAVIPFMITPGSDQIQATVTRDGQLAALVEVGGVVLANACGPCIGQWKRYDIEMGETNSIITSYNRNFRRRNDGNAETHNFIGSPEIVTAYAFAGRLDFNPLVDTLPTPDGQSFRFAAPQAPELPQAGFVEGSAGFIPPSDAWGDLEVRVDPDSERLQLLEPFPAWHGQEMEDLRVLLKAQGKCTTDHISAAGPWLRFRGHLPRICGNLFLGAVNAFTGETGKGRDVLANEDGVSFPRIALRWRQQGQPWVVVGDENYGEGSSREHAAMEPRYMGCQIVVVKSFARIHETNLKKQGILALTFADPADFELIQAEDVIATEGVVGLAPGQPVYLLVRHRDGRRSRIATRHSYNDEQIKWFEAGSALNLLRR